MSMQSNSAFDQFLLIIDAFRSNQNKFEARLFTDEEQSKLVQTYWQSVFLYDDYELKSVKAELQQSSYRRFESKCSCQNHNCTNN
jgi:hypothetical protein